MTTRGQNSSIIILSARCLIEVDAAPKTVLGSFCTITRIYGA
jgi:hypothetical protein